MIGATCMNTIGNKIKELRKKRGLTQEQLADAIGISFQAVSKWETSITLPDVTMIPKIAGFFGVTTDSIFNFDLKEIESRVDEICNEAYQFRETDPEKGKEILESGLKQYPDNDIILNNLLYVMNYSKDPDTTIKLCNKLIEQTNKFDVKYDAYRFLAYAYKAKGEIELAKKAVEQIPEIYFNKLTEVAFVSEGKEKQEAAEKQKWVSFENLIQMMWLLAEYYESIGKHKEFIKETEKAIKLIEIMDNKNYDKYIDFFKSKLK